MSVITELLDVIIKALPFPISRKVATQFLTNVLSFVVVLVVTKLGLHINADVSLVLSSAVGVVAGVIVAWFVREFPVVPASAPAIYSPPPPPTT